MYCLNKENFVNTFPVDYIKNLDVEQVKESLRFASDETIQKIAKFLTEDQYTYAQATLPPLKASVLSKARQDNALPSTS